MSDRRAKIELTRSGYDEDFILLARPLDHYIPPQMLDRISRLSLLAKTRRERQVIGLHLYRGLPFSRVGDLTNLTSLAVQETLESVAARERIASRFNQSEEALIRPVPQAKKEKKNGKKRTNNPAR